MGRAGRRNIIVRNHLIVDEAIRERGTRYCRFSTRKANYESSSLSYEISNRSLQRRVMSGPVVKTNNLVRCRCVPLQVSLFGLFPKSGDMSIVRHRAVLKLSGVIFTLIGEDIISGLKAGEGSVTYTKMTRRHFLDISRTIGRASKMKLS